MGEWASGALGSRSWRARGNSPESAKGRKALSSETVWKLLQHLAQSKETQEPSPDAAEGVGRGRRTLRHRALLHCGCARQGPDTVRGAAWQAERKTVVVHNVNCRQLVLSDPASRHNGCISKEKAEGTGPREREELDLGQGRPGKCRRHTHQGFQPFLERENSELTEHNSVCRI